MNRKILILRIFLKKNDNSKKNSKNKNLCEYRPRSVSKFDSRSTFWKVFPKLPYIFQYVMAHAWFWDPSGPYIVNHRLLYMGLHNMNGEYMWTSGTQLR